MARRAGGAGARAAPAAVTSTTVTWSTSLTTPMSVLILLLVAVLRPALAADPIYGLGLVKCKCQGNEVVTTDGSCLEQPGGTTVITETGQVSTSRVSVSVAPLKCSKGHQVTLGQGDVHLRHRGDWVVLRGPWRGLRINHYCLKHYLTTTGFLTWSIDVCIPPPVVPRCCPEGQSMAGDRCANSSTLELGPFNPPLLAGPGERPIKWPGQTEKMTPLAPCTKGGRVQQVLVGRQAERRASVIALPTGLVLVTRRGSQPVEYTFAPDFCIDAGVNHQAGGENASYFAFYCDAVRVSDLRCNDTNVCVRKCCGEGQAMHAHISQCVPTKDAFIAPFEKEHPREVHVLVGLPPCQPIGHVALDKGVDQRGGLLLQGQRYNASEYCLDNFIRGNTSSVEVLMCIRDTQKTGWASVRLYITPVFLAISAAAAVVLLLLMWLLPELRRDGGQAQASHAFAILLATLTLLILQVPNQFSKGSCIFMAVLLHFSFMSMFTWVAIMSLVLWKRVRNIAGSGGGPPIDQTLIQQCAGWGIPLLVIILNVTIHFTVPTDQTGVIHPRIAEGRCWYAGTIEVLLYFYLPILLLVLTSAVATGMSLWCYCTMSRESISMNGLGDQQPNFNSTASDMTSNTPNGNHESDTQELTHSFNYTHEIRQHSILIGFAIFFWLTEGLSMKIEPVDIWSLADIINSLYGLVALLVFILNPNKWKHIQLHNLKSSFRIKFEKMSEFLKSLCRRT